VDNWNGSPTVLNVDHITFSGGAELTQLSAGHVLIEITGSGGSSFTGDPNRVVLTDGDGDLTTEPWLKWNDSDESIEFGADAVGKTGDSGKIKYNKSEGYLDIFGAGTGTPRKIRFREDVYVDGDLFANFGQQLFPSKQVTNGDSHDHNGGDGGTLDHTNLVGIGTNTHAQVDTHIASTSNPHSTTAAQVAAIPDTGWIARSETWTRTGNHTFTASGDLTTVFRKGTKIRYNDGSLEYGTVSSSSHAAGTTTINLFVNDGYAMAATTITDKNVSYIENPEGFPEWFNYANTITYSANGSMTFTSVSTTYARFKTSGKTCFFEVFGTGTTGGTASTQLETSLPAACFDSNNHPCSAATRDATSGLGVVGTGAVSGNNSVIFVRKLDNSVYGLGTGRFIQCVGFYQY